MGRGKKGREGNKRDGPEGVAAEQAEEEDKVRGRGGVDGKELGEGGSIPSHI